MQQHLHPDSFCRRGISLSSFVWNDVTASVVKVWRHIKNMTPSIDAYLTGEQLVQISALSDLNWQSMKWRHGRHLESVTSYWKSGSINPYTWRTISPNFIPIWFEIRGRGNYTAGMVNSVPLKKWGGKTCIFRPTFHDLMSLKCTKLHRFAPIFSKNFSGDNTSDPQNWEVLPRLLPSATAHRPTFSQLPRPLFETMEP